MDYASRTSNTDVICVLGMHRSGTSCLTGSLESHGLYLGDVINHAPYNLKGNKENRELWKINDLALEQSGGAWDRPPSSLSWNSEVVSMRDKLIQSYNHISKWGFKDPRCMLTLPIWLDGIPSLKLCGTFRHPHAVAKSLENRNGFPLEKSFSLWKTYNELLITYADNFKFPLICFDWSHKRYDNEVTRLASYLGLNNTPEGPAFFDQALRSHSYSDQNTQNIPNELLKLYDKLNSLAELNSKVML